MRDTLEFVFSSFWVWVGCWFIFYVAAETIYKCWTRFTRMRMVRKHGWPPSHLDADGDWESTKDQGEDACRCDQCKAAELIVELKENQTVAREIGADAVWDELENAILQSRRWLVSLEQANVCPRRKN